MGDAGRIGQGTFTARVNGGSDDDVALIGFDRATDRPSPNASVAVPTNTGETVALSSLTDVQFSAGAQAIRRRDKRIASAITLQLEEGREEETRRRLQTLAARIDLPEGITFGRGTVSTGPSESQEAMAFAATLSVVFIYLLMGFLFESFMLPLSIVFTIPLAGIGVVWAHILIGKDIDFLGMVGLVLLIGVVVNNGIVLLAETVELFRSKEMLSRKERETKGEDTPGLIAEERVRQEIEREREQTPRKEGDREREREPADEPTDEPADEQTDEQTDGPADRRRGARRGSAPEA